ncbi:hypothetical protein QBC41DRAFT_41955 [Cercophora samala]|uniref:Uncharacterized protein n=1 Tax=Cercophora samala TaxID=330535 RepID=A0AA39YX52_9PEZI|nr:hypothetical protein QBC41DRAFT_41955 [Cercophora samala]
MLGYSDCDSNVEPEVALCRSVTTTRTIETFLRLGADPRVLITLKIPKNQTTEYGETESRFLIFKFGDNENPTVGDLRILEGSGPGLARFSLDKRPITLLEWIEQFPDDVPNKKAVLALIDEKISDYQHKFKQKIAVERRVDNAAISEVQEEANEDGSKDIQEDTINGSLRWSIIGFLQIPTGHLLSFLLGALIIAFISTLLQKHTPPR